MHVNLMAFWALNNEIQQAQMIPMSSESGAVIILNSFPEHKKMRI